VLDAVGFIAVLVALPVAVRLVGARWPAVLTADSKALVGAAAAAAGVAAIFATGHPTGTTIVDPVLRAAFAVLVTLAAASAKPWTWLVAAAAATVGTPSQPIEWAATAALGLATGCSIAGKKGPVVGSVGGALVAQPLLGMTYPSKPGVTAGIAAAVALVLCLSAWRAQSAGARRGLALALGAIVAFVALAGGSYIAAAAGERAAISRAVDGASQGLADAKVGRSSKAAQEFRGAATGFTSVHDRLSAWWTRPALIVPILAQQVRAVDVLSRAGVDLSDAAATTSENATNDALHMRAGAIDLTKVAALAAPLDHSVAVMDQVTTELPPLRSVWLTGAVDHQVDRLDTEVGKVRGSARSAADAARLVPALLGRDAPRRYFVAMTTPAELRGAGGIIGNYGILLADKGRLRLERQGRIADLLPPSGSQWKITSPQDYVFRYGRIVGLFPQDATYSPDFPSDAGAIEQIYQQAAGVHLDGVIAIDPIGLSALLELTGSTGANGITVPSWPEPLTKDNVVGILLHDSYVALAQPQRIQLLDETISAVFGRLTATSLAEPNTIVGALGPVVRSKHIMLFSTTPAEEGLLTQINAAGAMPPVHGDFLSVVSQNGGATKLDWFLRRAISYDVTYDPASGRVHAKVEVRLTNLAPSEGLPPIDYQGNQAGEVKAEPLGQNATFLALYTPLGLSKIQVDGQPTQITSEVERNRFVYTAFIAIPPGATSVLTAELDGAIGAGPYHLEMASQPTVFPDDLKVAVHGPAGWTVTGLDGLQPAAGAATAGGNAVAGGMAHLQFNQNWQATMTFEPPKTTQ
jgi:hypothetical protein